MESNRRTGVLERGTKVASHHSPEGGSVKAISIFIMTPILVTMRETPEDSKLVHSIL